LLVSEPSTQTMQAIAAQDPVMLDALQLAAARKEGFVLVDIPPAG
jgi:hypothetical protein